MKIHELTWSTLRPFLDVYEKLAPRDRETLRAMKGAQSVDRDEFQGPLKPLLAAGFLRQLKTSARVTLTPEARPTLVGIRAAARCRVLRSPSVNAVREYVQETLSAALRAELLPDSLRSRQDDARALAERIGTIDWIHATLAADSCRKWKRAHAAGWSRTEHIYTALIRDLMERLVAGLASAGGPVPVQDLAELLPKARTGDINRLFRAALRYLVVFPGIDAMTGTFVIGLHPAVQDRISREAVAPPEVVDAELSPFPGLRLPDLHQLLVAVGGGHIRVKTDGEVFKKDAEALAMALSPPPPVGGPWQYREPIDRLGPGVSRGLELGLFRIGPGTGGRKRLVVTEAGRAWIALPAQERLQAVLDRTGPLAEPPPAEDAHWNSWYASDAGPTWSSIFAGCYSILDYRASHVPLRDACLDVLRTLPTQGGVRRLEFLHYAASEQNPFLQQGPHAHGLKLDRHADSQFSTERREHLWGAIVNEALETHLMPWDGLSVGELLDPSDSEKDILIGLSPMGAWLLGLAENPPKSTEVPAHVVVQPTFEVMFFAPDLRCAAELAPFCDRVGESVGVVFQITKESIARAAAAGIPSEVIHETLDRLSRTPVPGNVHKEIDTWHGRQRVLVLKQPWVLDCGDAETADRVLAAARSKLERLSGNLLALKGRTKPETVAKLLASHGVTLDTSQVPEPKKRAKRRRARRGYW